jgi:BirA family transcriptional regulator, biotin operon repressor / biotin---[acetyl-CoA-carboxylase] ligase
VGVGAVDGRSAGGGAGGVSGDLLDVGVLGAAGEALGLRVEVVGETGSTNADVAARARVGEAAGLVVAAERQRAGRGRLDRVWESPAGVGLTVSLLARPAGRGRSPAVLGWVPMVVGTSLVGTLRSRYGVPAWLKWPNDVQVDGEKLAGILVELVPAPPANPGAVASRPDGANKGPGLVIGFGLNVHTAAADLPPGATSLAVLAGRGAGCLVGTAADQGDGPALAGTGRAAGADGVPSRTELLAALLTDLAGALAAFDADPGGARPAYRAVCATLGLDVRVELPGGESVVGVATDVDESGRLVVDGRAFSAADVVHLRPAANK